MMLSMAQLDKSEEEWRKGPWTPQEDKLLVEHIKLHGEGKWNDVSRLAGLKRNGKSCRLRWVNYLRPDLKRGQISPREESIILELHARWGNRWSTIARCLPGRTDNEIKNYWRTHFKKKETIPSHKLQKSRIHLLKRQQSQLQQQQNDQIETKRVMSIFDEKYSKLVALAQHRQEMVHPATADEQYYLYSVLNSYESKSRASTDVGWDELWNVENDIYGNMAN